MSLAPRTLATMANVSHPRKRGHVGDLINVNAPSGDISTKSHQDNKGENHALQRTPPVRRRHVASPSARIKELDILKNSPRRIAVLRANGLLSPSTSGNITQPKGYEKMKVPSQPSSTGSLRTPVVSSRSQGSSYRKGACDRSINYHRPDRAASDKNLVSHKNF
jgi:hypothetical protein